MIKIIRIYQKAAVTDLYVRPNCNYDLGKNADGLIVTFPFDDFIKESDNITPINKLDIHANKYISVVNNTVVITHINDINFEYRHTDSVDNAKDTL